MEPYVIHWLDGIERDYHHRHDQPEKKDYVHFIKKQPNSNPLESVRIEVNQASPLAFDPALLTVRPWIVKDNKPAPKPAETKCWEYEIPPPADPTRRLSILEEHCFPKSYQRLQLIADIKFPTQKSRGLSDIFEENDFAHYLHRHKRKNNHSPPFR
ncbi:hypothetical protein PSACC_00638 [Paramicrosporidium saccamoebae]|uniref:Uncharacterized protein n=1 Tax=Paramicrosporidium saccamoebae TaxID=1246581 RepID=A0A2H9TP89_9FUNG|nr:hypothetical protein PSACC_00638 [Paramicrosporidium saccamoebae]